MKVAILYDADGWAQHRHALGLQKHAGPDFDVKIGLMGHSSDAEVKEADVVYMIYLAGTRKIKGKLTASCVASHAWLYKEEDPSDWRTLGTNKTRNSKQGVVHLRGCDFAVCRNSELANWATTHGHRRARYIPAGIDRSVFNPSGRRPPGKRLRIGWCGQIVAHFKGYEHVYKPLKRRLKDDKNFEWYQITHGAKQALSQYEMAEWYRNIDIFLTTASAEGTPNPPFEAAACGCAVISTDMGQPANWTAIRECGNIVPTYRNATEADRTIGYFESKLLHMKDPKNLSGVQQALSQSINDVYDYRVVAPQLLNFISGND